MTTQIPQQPARRSRIERRRIVDIHSGMQTPQAAEPIALDKLAQGLDVGIPAAVMKHAQDHALGFRRPVKVPPAIRIGGEGLVGDDLMVTASMPPAAIISDRLE